MARKLPGLRRELDARSLFSVAYGEIAASIYFALGIIALHASASRRSCCSASASLPARRALVRRGDLGPPRDRRRGDVRPARGQRLAGFMTGWVIFLDYLIVIALSALFIPHYLAGALQVSALDRNPWDVIVGVIAIVASARSGSCAGHRSTRSGSSSPRST